MSVPAARIRVYRALDTFIEQATWTLEKVRGLGIDSRLIRWAAAATIVAGVVKPIVAVQTRCKVSPTAARLALAVWPSQRDGWIQFGSVWAIVTRSPTSSTAMNPDTVWIAATEAELWTELRRAFAAQYPAAVLAEHRGVVHVTADRSSNIRRLTPRESALAARVAKYATAGVATGVLLYGPQGSGKTTTACSIASAAFGSYFRLSADHLGSDEIYTLHELQPRAVVIDDLDRVHDVALLELLDSLKASGVSVFATSNTSPDTRHGDDPRDLMDAALVRSGRFDIHEHVAGLDSASHAQICRDNGLADVDLGPRARELLASDLVSIGRMHAVGDLPDPAAVVEDLLVRRTNTTRTLGCAPRGSVMRTIEAEQGWP